MAQQIDSLVNNVGKLVPAVKKSEIEHVVYQMSQRSGISMESLLTTLYEDLLSGIPFQYTAVGKSRSISLW